MPDSTSEPLPPRLYKFRTYGRRLADGKTDDNDKREVFNLLSGRIRFSRLADFNDPFEGRPHAIPAFEDPGKQREAILKYSFQFYREQGIPPGKARKQAEAIVRGRTQQELVDLAGERVIETSHSDGIYICCLSDHAALSTPLIWSHYSDRHRGVAIHFSTQHAPFSFANIVEYSESYPEVIVPRIHQDPWEHVKRIFLTKSTLWSYEHEFRIMRVDWPSPGRDPKAATLRVGWEGTTALAERESVVGITLGAMMEEKDKRDLIAQVKAEFPHLEIWQASLHQKKYEIVRKRIK